MGSSRTEMVRCPNCGAESETIIWNNVSVTQKDPMAGKVRNGNIFHFSCPECGNTVKLVYPFLYHDDEQKQLLCLAADESTFQASRRMYELSPSPEIESMAAEGYRIRIVRSVPELQEKLRIFDEKLDDRVIEIIKLLVCDELIEQNPDLVFDAMYFTVNESEEGETSYGFELKDHGKDVGWIGFDPESIEKISEAFREQLSDSTELRTVIDTAWALEAAEKRGKS